MKVVLDTSVVLGEGQSSFRYFSELIPRLKQNPELSLEILPSPYFDLPKDWYPENPAYKPLILQASWLPPGRLRSTLSKVKAAFEGQRKKRLLFKSDRTIFHSFFYTLPPKTESLGVTMALDAVFEKLGATIISPAAFKNLAESKRLALSRASRVISISHSTTQDIIDIYNISPDIIDTIYLGVNTSFFFEKSTPTFTFEKPYILQVGGRMHHRNFSNLLKAFAVGTFKTDYLLVCVGEPWSDEEEVLIKHLGLQTSTQLVRNPTNLELRSLYQHAQMLVYPSLYEGFGFPLVEAMACGAPVVTSLNSGSIPEVAGNAALYFDPRDPSDIAKKMGEALDPLVAADLIKKGFENIKRFSWDETAKKTIEVYRKVLTEE